MYCHVCGEVDEHYDENANMLHSLTPKHKCNMILANYKLNKHLFSKNRDGILIFCDAESSPYPDAAVEREENCDKHNIRIYAKPNQKVKFSFRISNDLKDEDVLVVGVQLAHPQPLFQMNSHCYIFGLEPHVLKKKSTIEDQVSVVFEGADIGQYEMPIVFTFHRKRDKKNLIFVREMVVMVDEHHVSSEYKKSPYTKAPWEQADRYIRSTSTDHLSHQATYKIPPLLKKILPGGLNEEALMKLREAPETKEKMRSVLMTTRGIFDEGLTIDNYRMYFHHLLWWEEIITKINLKKFNMADVTIEKKVDGTYWLEVPGLAEKRPSLLRGDKVLVRPQGPQKVLFESVIEKMDDTGVQLSKLHESFETCYSPAALFNIRFLMSRVPMERMHEAVSRVFTTKHQCRVFPEPVEKAVRAKPIAKFYNESIKNNAEQRSAVEHIVSKTSGKTPYIVFGPPGTGKTMTIVEAIIQLVVKSPSNRVMVCTESNMAADHIALALLHYNRVLNMNNFILRANSRNREWSIMPPELKPVSNGNSYETFHSMSNASVAMHRILVTTLLHAAKYGSPSSQSKHHLQMTHLFIDEAAQAKEPAALVPITGLLAPTGQLVLAGDPQQLGPVCISKEANDRGLGTSLLERLWLTYENLYRTDDPNYITTLVMNFRNDPDILLIPNKLFYSEKPLQPQAKPDPLTKRSILGLPGGDKAVVFHAVHSREQKMGNAPSYFNEKELAMLQRYTVELTTKLGVSQKDIGIIAPYIRQVYKMRDWLKTKDYGDVEIGTVESFQGKEKRVILVSTVRANCRLLDFDAKYGLGFLVDDKRFNVALTRAKAKVVIIGNPTCLTRDLKWRMYMELCKKEQCYFGQETEQLERSSRLLLDVARERFDRCRLTEALEVALKKFQEKHDRDNY